MAETPRPPGRARRLIAVLGPEGRVKERVESPWTFFGPLSAGARGGGGTGAEGSRAAQGARRARHLYSVGNATAGLFAGDALELRIRVLPGASVAVTTPAASYAFTMPEGEASVRTRIEVEAGADLDYAPLPLIPFAGSALTQLTEVFLAEGAGLRLLDTLVLGRIDYGEAGRFRLLHASTSLFCGGRLVLRDALRLEPQRLPPGVLDWGWGGQKALGTLILAGARAEGWNAAPGALRLWAEELQRGGVRAGASRLEPGLVLLRAVGPYPEEVREALERMEGWGLGGP